jgi:hypothetical protein
MVNIVSDPLYLTASAKLILIGLAQIDTSNMYNIIVRYCTHNKGYILCVQDSQGA